MTAILAILAAAVLAVILALRARAPRYPAGYEAEWGNDWVIAFSARRGEWYGVHLRWSSAHANYIVVERRYFGRGKRGAAAAEEWVWAASEPSLKPYKPGALVHSVGYVPDYVRELVE